MDRGGVMALDVIGAGLGRTGTFSLKFALEYLGFGPCHHMAEVRANARSQLPKWLAAIDGGADWDWVFQGYRSAVDHPGCAFWRELVVRYPDAKVILTVRDPDAWFRSVSETIFSPQMRALFTDGPLAKFMSVTVWGDFIDRIDDRDYMTDYFRRWTDEVSATVPAERLLVFEAKHGWQPLCDFLGLPIPDVPYPRTNERNAMAESIAAHDGQAGDDIAMVEARGRQDIDDGRRQAFGL
jgi:hypothetical protein